MTRFFFLFFLLSLVYIPSYAKVIRLVDEGILKKKNLMERYYKLYNIYNLAKNNGNLISYEGINNLDILIPKGAKPIPLLNENDFGGVTLKVRNDSQNTFLFDITSPAKYIDIKSKDIDVAKFSGYSDLKKGKHLVIIEDANLWVNQRKGYSYGHIRKDILYVENGEARNRVVQPYHNKHSLPKCSVVIVDKQITISNLTIIRDQNSTFITKCFRIQNQNNVSINNMRIETLNNPNFLYGDANISVKNCTNLTMSNVRIEGSYSLKDKFGYGINMDNVWNCKFKRLYGQGNWGIFGNNNVNEAYLEDCDINRFDVHCYGKNITFKNCSFKGYYNQYSGVYGTILYNNCTFDDFTPYINDGSFNAHVPVNVVLKNCTWYISKKKNWIIDDRGMVEKPNMRYELRIKQLPSVKVENLKIQSIDGAVSRYVIYKKEYKMN